MYWSKCTDQNTNDQNTNDQNTTDQNTTDQNIIDQKVVIKIILINFWCSAPTLLLIKILISAGANTTTNQNTTDQNVPIKILLILLVSCATTTTDQNLMSKLLLIKMAPVIRGRRYLDHNEQPINTNTIQIWHKYNPKQKHKYKCPWIKQLCRQIQIQCCTKTAVK